MPGEVVIILITVTSQISAIFFTSHWFSTSFLWGWENLFLVILRLSSDIQGSSYFLEGNAGLKCVGLQIRKNLPEF